MAQPTLVQHSGKKSFRLHLQEELLRRCRSNPGYSLRAFARALQVNPASLSRMLRGERVISEEMKERLAIRLGLGPRELSELATEPSGAGATGDLHYLCLGAFAVLLGWA